MVTAVEASTGGNVIVKLAYVAPAGTITLAGTGAVTGSDVDSVTTAPPDGAGPFRFTRFAVYEFPPAIDAGDGVMELIATGTTVSMLDLVTPSYVAVMVTGVEPVTAVVGILKTAYVDPGGTPTLEGGVATVVSELLSRTVMPPGVAGPSRFTRIFPAVAPPATVAGEMVKELRAGRRTVRVVLGDEPPYDAVMVTGVETVTMEVVTLNAALLAPAATVTLGGGEAMVTSDDESVTVAPPDGAGPFRYTLFAVEVGPPAMVAGASATDEAAMGFNVRVAGLFRPPYDAVMVTGVVAVTPEVVMLKLGENVAPEGTSTDAGTDASVASEAARETVTPDGPAGPSR